MNVVETQERVVEVEPLDGTSRPSVHLAWVLVGLVAALALLLVPLEAGIEGEPVPNFIWAADDESSGAEADYAAAVGVPAASVQLDIDAVEDLAARDVDPCPALGAPQVPADLAPGVPVECNPFDGHGGVGYPMVATVVAAVGAAIVTWRRNRIGLYLALIVLLDMVGAVAGAYAFRSLVIDPGSLPLGTFAGFVGAQAWIPMLVVAVPLLVLSIPTGRLRSHRWRWVMVAAGVAAGLLAVTQALHPFLIGPALNPIAAPWSVTTANTIFDYGNLLWMVVMLAAFASVAVRAVTWSYRRLRRAG